VDQVRPSFLLFFWKPSHLLYHVMQVFNHHGEFARMVGVAMSLSCGPFARPVVRGLHATQKGSAMPHLLIVGQNIDTFIGNARLTGDFPDDLAGHLEHLKRSSQEAEEDLATPWRFAGEVLFIKPHGAGRQWKWMLHSPSIHVDVGLGRLTHIVAKARLSSAFLWEHEIGTALTLLYGFLADFLQVPFTLQVSEVHLCVDMADWELSVDEIASFITRSRSKGLRLATLDFSKGAPHACCIYDKTAEIQVSRKDWMQEVWKSNGWDENSSVTRVEFRYKRECLREKKVEEAYAFLDQIPSLWAHSTKQWLRHTIPHGDPNRARWALSSLWQLVQQANFFCDGTPAVRERRRAGDLTLLCQMIAGCSTSAAAFLTQVLPPQDDGTHFLIWFWDWFERYLTEKGVSFEQIREAKAARLGVVAAA
jgi:hypothetical protein